MNTKAVIEKITENNLVLLVGEKEDEILLSKDQIPPSIKYAVGDWLDIRMQGDNIEVLNVDQEETDKVKERIQEKMDRLRKRMDSK